ncbi:metallophosphoesterase [Calothrix sp. NIES-4071]|nr:metallophosphoesterase [Calothrix sp. NIES-4071]BAZ59607.1 metallophosphoesterase [Calothrix sp. NIES-4105]
MIERVSSILQQAGYDLSARELSEIIWLAVHLDESEISHQQPTLQVLQEDQSPTQTTETSKSPPTSSQPNEPVSNVFLPTVKSSSHTREARETVSIQIPAASSLRDSLALSRALRPLMRKVPSPIENILDEEATVRRIAEADIWAPVLKPAAQRWLELALVIEQTSTTAVWKQTITELQKLLKHHGAFRDVRTWKLEITGKNVQLFPQNSIGSYSTTPYKPEVLIDPKGQRLILLITDCISPTWRNRLIYPVLELWASKGLITILQLLPERLWERTALASEIPVQLRSLNPAISNSKLIANGELGMENWELELDDQVQNHIPIPIITLEPEPLRIWSKVLAGSGNFETAGFKFSACNNSVKTSPPTQHDSLNTTHLVSRFRATASPRARALAGLMAAAPVSLPVVQLIQQTLLPQSGQIHVAEVLMSGLLKPLTNVHQDNNPNYIEYDFIEGVRELLLDSVPISKTTSVLDAVSEYIARQLGISVTEFNARLLTPSSQTNDTLETQIRPFAHLKGQVLRRLGGVYADVAQKLDQISQLKVELISETGIDYTNLRNLLAAGKWQEADAETANVMLKAVGKEVLPNQYQFVFSDDIAKFPCMDLNTIDQLWETYTQGNFSFSAQKRILQEVSSTTTNDDETAIKWGERLGWYVNNTWLDLFTELQYTLNAPPGHFPVQWLPDVYIAKPNTDIDISSFPSFVWGGDSWRCLTTLIQKLADCNSNDSAHQLSKFEFDIITVNRHGEEIKRERCQAQYFTEDLGNDVTLEMVAIPSGKFMMGSPEGEGYENERPQHEVFIPSFFMSKYPITQAQWRAVIALPKIERDLNPPSSFKGDNFPIEGVSWYDAMEYCARLSQKTGSLYRLPSEAEWEYACRAGTTTPFYFGKTIIDKLANYNARGTFASEPRGEKRRKTTVVGTFPPNAFGLHDMHGLVWEWCLDTYHDNYEAAPSNGSAWVDQTDQKGKSFEQNQGILSRFGKSRKNILDHRSDNDNQIVLQRLLHGGSWINYPRDCRSASRNWFYPDYVDSNVGFRVVQRGLC